jgi:hypothetical protein
VDGVTLDVHAEDVGGVLLGLGRVVGELDAARLAPATDLHLSLDDHAAAEAVGYLAGFRHGGGDPAVQHRQPVPGEQRAPLVLVKVHCYLSTAGLLLVAGRFRQPSEAVTARRRPGARGVTSTCSPSG